jgi:hypothetical protein
MIERYLPNNEYQAAINADNPSASNQRLLNLLVLQIQE